MDDHKQPERWLVEFQGRPVAALARPTRVRQGVRYEVELGNDPLALPRLLSADEWQRGSFVFRCAECGKFSEPTSLAGPTPRPGALQVVLKDLDHPSGPSLAAQLMARLKRKPD